MVIHSKKIVLFVLQIPGMFISLLKRTCKSNWWAWQIVDHHHVAGTTIKLRKIWFPTLSAIGTGIEAPLYWWKCCSAKPWCNIDIALQVKVAVTSSLIVTKQNAIFPLFISWRVCFNMKQREWLIPSDVVTVLSCSYRVSSDLRMSYFSLHNLFWYTCCVHLCKWRTVLVSCSPFNACKQTHFTQISVGVFRPTLESNCARVYCHFCDTPKWFYREFSFNCCMRRLIEILVDISISRCGLDRK